MELRYQRDLYRVEVCCDTEHEEAFFGYPLQMCFRNKIPGILPCHGQTADGKLSICWDVTSRHTIPQIIGEGSLSVELLQRVLKALQETMQNLERFLIPCEYLVLEPDCIYLEAEKDGIDFLCDFGQKQSFHTTLLTFGEYVLEHMDHRNQEAMHLGYGLYRLAVEDTFDREAFERLLRESGTKPEITAYAEVYRDEKPRVLSAEDLPLQRPGANEDISEAEESKEQRLRREALQSFFAENEEETVGILWAKKGSLLCGLGIILGLVLMEGVVYFRNGRHLSPGWLLAGAAVLVMALGALAVMEIFSRWRQRAGGNKTTEKKKITEKKKNAVPKANKDTAIWQSKEPQEMLLKKHSLEEKGVQEETIRQVSEETMILSNFMVSSKEKPAVLACEDGQEYALKGEHWLIGKHRTEVDICLDRPTVSRLHARIFCRDGEYYLEDLNSRNGTRLNGNLLDGGQARHLEREDEICFADVRCVFR